MKIRELDPEEANLAIPFIRAFTEESRIPGGLVEHVFFRNWFGMISNGFGVLIGLFKDDALIGVLGGLLHKDLNDGVLCATETFWYMGKEHRGRGGMMLFRAFENWARVQGAKRWMMAHLHTLTPEKLERFCIKTGYVPVETHYVKEA